MKNVIPVALILQLVITAVELYGDVSNPFYFYFRFV